MAAGFQNLAIQIPIERDRGVLKRLRGTPMPQVGLLRRQGRSWCWRSASPRPCCCWPSRSRFFDLPLPATAAKWLTFAWVVAARHHRVHAVRHRVLVAGPHRPQRAGGGHPGRAGAAVHLRACSSSSPTCRPWMQQVAALFPLKWMCQGMRSVFLPESFAAQEAGGSWELGRVALVLAAVVRGRPGAVPDHVPLDHQARRLSSDRWRAPAPARRDSVGVEALAGLAAQVAGGDHALQQLRREELLVARCRCRCCGRRAAARRRRSGRWWPAGPSRARSRACRRCPGPRRVTTPDSTSLTASTTSAAISRVVTKPAMSRLTTTQVLPISSAKARAVASVSSEVL